MLNRLKISALALLVTTCSLPAVEHLLEVRVAAFVPTGGLFREIYGSVGADYELEYTLRWSRTWAAWANLAWYPKHGHSIGLESPTRVNLGNLSVGVRVLYDFNQKVSGYLGLGPSLTGVWVNNQACCSCDRVSKTTVGGVAKLGCYVYLYKSLYADLFVDYLYQPIHFESTVNVGGLKAGLGLGVRL